MASKNGSSSESCARLLMGVDRTARHRRTVRDKCNSRRAFCCGAPMHTILRGVDSGMGARDWRSAIRQSHIQPAQYALLLRYRRAGVPAATSALKAEWAAIARDLLDKTRSLCAPMVVDGRSASSLAADHRSRAADRRVTNGRGPPYAAVWA